MLVTTVAAASREVGATSSRLAKVDRIAALLGIAEAGEVPIVVSWLSGELPQRQIGVGWAALRSLPEPSDQPTLTVLETDAVFSALKAESGAGSQGRRAAAVEALFGRATADEQQFLVRLIGGELRQGALGGIMSDAVAKSFGVPPAAVRRAAMLSGDLAATAALASGGVDALADVGLEVGRPIGPMLAQPATGVEDALSRLNGPAVLETKLDGARIQVHRDGSDVAIYTRTLEDITARLPEVVEAVLALPVRRFVADGEAIALHPDGRPHKFQVTASRFGRKVNIADARTAVPLSPFFFDLLHLDGADLLDEPLATRLAALDEIVPAGQRVARLVTSVPAAAEDFVAEVLRRGHEGVMAKSPESAYEAGRRGASWLKIKPVHTLDLVVLAVEWGSGRRTGTLSNIHLGARDPVSGGFVMLGKTFKGMTDEMLAWQTRRFTELADGPTDGWVVSVRPEQVVEVAFDGVQASSRYPGGMALRFARVVRYRDDKSAAQADTIDAVRAIYGP
jgi:DNA ligase-1